MSEYEDDNFLSTWFSFGLVVKSSVDDIQKIKKFVSELKETKIIFSKVELKDLYISVRDN